MGKVTITFSGIGVYVRSEENNKQMMTFMVPETSGTANSMFDAKTLPAHSCYLEHHINDLSDIHVEVNGKVSYPLIFKDVFFKVNNSSSNQGLVIDSSFDKVPSLDEILGQSKVLEAECFSENPQDRCSTRVHLTEGTLSAESNESIQWQLPKFSFREESHSEIRMEGSYSLVNKVKLEISDVTEFSIIIKGYTEEEKTISFNTERDIEIAVDNRCNFDPNIPLENTSDYDFDFELNYSLLKDSLQEKIQTVSNNSDIIAVPKMIHNSGYNPRVDNCLPAQTTT